MDGENVFMITVDDCTLIISCNTRKTLLRTPTIDEAYEMCDELGYRY